MEKEIYKIAKIDGEWKVYCGVFDNRNHYFTKHDIVFKSNSLSDCYAYVKAKQEGLIM